MPPEYDTIYGLINSFVTLTANRAGAEAKAAEVTIMPSGPPECMAFHTA
jgi:hypothetical protein